jgi:hypothetical protein
VLAGVGLGLAAATKYTAGIVALPLLVAGLLRAREVARPAVRGLLLGGGVAALAFVIANPHAVLSFSEFWSDLKKQQSEAGDLGKLGLSYDSGILYYLWTITWGVGWAPALAAVAGAVLAFQHDTRRATFLVPWPAALIVAIGLQDRYFGRWLMPALPAIALLAAFAVVRVADLSRAGPRARTAVVAVGAVALVAQAVVHSVHVDRVLAREDTRGLARQWMVDHIPAGSKLVVEPIVPISWFGEPGHPNPATGSGARWRKFIVARTTLTEQGTKSNVGRTISIEDYERTTRPALIGSYERGGFCWVVIGSTQYGRALREPAKVPRALRYYRALARHGDLVYAVRPYKAGKRPVEFNFDWSFDFYPLAYERPGPTVLIYRLHAGACGKSGVPQRTPRERRAPGGQREAPGDGPADGVVALGVAPLPGPRGSP